MSILGGAIGAGVVLAAITHEMSLARKAEKINAEREMGEEVARLRERASREDNLQAMRDVTDANIRSRMMRAGMVPMARGRAGRAVELQELARSRRY